MAWTIEYFEDDDGTVPAVVWEDSLPEKLAGKVLGTLKIIATTEGQIGGGKIEACHGYPNLLEARTRLGNDLAREFLTRDGNRLIVLTGIVKPNGTPTPPEAFLEADAYKRKYNSTKRIHKVNE